MVSLHPLPARVITLAFLSLSNICYTNTSPLHLFIMKDTLNSILVLLLDMRNMESKIHLKNFLKSTAPAEYCILLNPRPQDIRQLRGKYRPQEQTDPHARCTILSRINIDTDSYPLPPAKARWIVIHNVRCLLIEILGIYFLLSYLDDVEERYQQDFLIAASRYSITKNNFIDTPHFLIGYLDHRRYQGLELMNALDWQYLEPDGGEYRDYMSSFHLLLHADHVDTYSAFSIDFVETENLENSVPLHASYSHPILLHIPCSEENIEEHLLACLQKDHLRRTP